MDSIDEILDPIARKATSCEYQQIRQRNIEQVETIQFLNLNGSTYIYS